MNSNNNNNVEGNKNGYHCPRCSNGVLIRDNADIVCLSCGLRLSYILGKESQTYMVEAVIARLVYGTLHDTEELEPKHWQMAGLAG